MKPIAEQLPFDDPGVAHYWRTVSGLHPFAVRRRVLHVVAPGFEGIFRYVRQAASFQRQGGWEVHVAGPAGQCAEGQVTSHSWAEPEAGSTGALSEAKALGRIVAEVAPEAVVLHGSRAGLSGRLALRGSLPTVYMPHVWPFVFLPSARASAAVRWERYAARWTNLIVAVSDAQVTATVKNGIQAPLAMVHNPVPTGWSPRTESDRAEARQRLGLGTAPLAVSVGRLTEQKGHDALLRAWPAVHSEVPAAELAIVGDGPLRGQLASSLPPGATLAGEVADPRDWVAAADVVVLPSRWEGMSLAMLEAMAASRSVVITAVAGSEVVAKAEAGAVVPVGNDRELAAAVARRLIGGRDNDIEGRRGAAQVAKFNDRVGCYLRLSAYISRAHVFGVNADRA